MNQEDKAIEHLRFNSADETALFESIQGGVKPPLVDFFLLSDNDADLEKHDKDLKEWATYMSNLKSNIIDSKDRGKFLKRLFYKTHRKYLKKYQNHSTLPTLLRDGKYDCLSGTSMYVLLLDELGYNYGIIETDYHIYLLVEEEGKKYILESTDPISGFISDQSEILERQKIYLDASFVGETQIQGISTESPEYQFSRKVNNSISSYQLAGLHYYNQGVYLYNNHKYSEAIKSLHKALFLYNSPRIKEFLNLTLSVALASEKLGDLEKEILKELNEEWDNSNSLSAKK